MALSKILRSRKISPVDQLDGFLDVLKQSFLWEYRRHDFRCNWGWSTNGATHRKKYDTPSLRGVTFATKR